MYNPVMNLVIQKATIKDLDMILKLNKELFDFEVQFQHEYNSDWPYGEGQTYFKKRLRSRKSLVFVAMNKEAIIGYIVGFIDNYSYRSSKVNPICEIENMFVLEDYRRKGVGKLLIETIRKEAAKRGVKLLRVGAIAQNLNAIHFYRSQGFSDSNLYLEEKL